MAHALAVRAPKRPQCRRCGYRHNPQQGCVGVRLQVATDGATKAKRKLLPKPGDQDRQKPRDNAVVLSLPTKKRTSKSNSPISPRQFQFHGLPTDPFRPEPFNAYPIPTVGVVHRMMEYCETSPEMTKFAVLIFGSLTGLGTPAGESVRF